MGTVRKTIQNLKPGKDYLLAVRSVNTDLGVASDPTDFIRFTVPEDNTIPSIPEGLSLVASFLNVMFVFNNVTDLDISHYEYELYKVSQITEVNQEYQILSGELPYRSGINSANVFVVSVDENSTTSSTSSVDSPVAFYGRVRSVDTSGNISNWTPIAKSGDTPLIDEEFIGSLTAAKITAGTISSAEITLSGSNSVIQSSTYKDPLNPGQNGWYINGNGEFSLGGPDGINYNGSAITIGSDVQVTANFSADSITVGTGLSSTLEINDAVNNGGGGMTLGNPLYNYWYANGRFSVGDADHSMVWNGSDLLVNGTSITGGSVGGISVGLDKIFIGTGTFNNSNTAFYADNLGRFSLKDRLSWDGTTLSVNGSVNSTVGRIGPFDIGEDSLRSVGYNPNNYMEILSYGDLFIYSKPLDGGHANQTWRTYALGEWIQVERTDSGFSHFARMGNWWAGNGAAIGLGYNGNENAIMSVINNYGSLDLRNSLSVTNISLSGQNGNAYFNGLVSAGNKFWSGGITFDRYNNWGTDYSGNGGGAGIANDNNSYKALMIVGNNSGNGSTRIVKMWDDVIINGALSSSSFSTGSLSSSGLSSSGNIFVRNTSPTIYMQDTNNRSAMIHVNSNLFYVLRGNGNDSTTWEAVNGRWPLVIDLENNNMEVGGEAYCWQWWRSYGQTGWYNQTYVGGIYMSDSDWVRVYQKGLYAESGGMGAALPATSTTSGYSYMLRSNFFGTFYYFTSRLSTKENVLDLTDTMSSGEIIDKLRPVTFVEKYRAPLDNPDQEEDVRHRSWRQSDIQVGFVAEEVHDVSPYLTNYDAQDDELVPTSWKWEAIITVLVNEVKQLRKRVSLLEQESSV